MSLFPKVSLILPVYNVELYIRQCINSILKQTLKEIEIILVNDGSTDSSADICNEYANLDGRIFVIHQENSGSFTARKKGVAASSGKYIMFIDPDDYLTTLTSIEDVYLSIEKEAVDILNFSVEVISTDNRDLEIFTRRLSSHEKKLNGSVSILEDCFIKRKHAWNPWNKIYNGDICRKAYNLKDIALYRATDVLGYFIIAYCSNSYKSIKTKPIYTYRIGDGVSTKKEMDLVAFKKLLSEILIEKQIRNFLRNQNAENVYYSFNDAWGKLANEHIVHGFLRLNKHEQKKAWEYLENVKWGRDIQTKLFLGVKILKKSNRQWKLILYRILYKISFSKFKKNFLFRYKKNKLLNLRLKLATQTFLDLSIKK